MANATIKITQLPPIGNNLTASTILPVVSLTGTATTDKVAVSNIANFTLLNAGNTLPPAYLSNLTYSVVNAAQPNITSLGNLNGLTITNLNNFYLPGGTNGQLLSTDGSGNLSWVTGNSGGTPGGSNSQVQFNNNGNFAGNSSFTFDSINSILSTTNFISVNANISGALTTPSLAVTGTSNTRNIIANGNITANFFIGSGSQLSNIAGANVSGEVSNANFATTSANTNFAITANYSAYAGNITISAQSNITSLGNLTGLQSNGVVFINNTTQSTSNATGALRVLGGIGATGNIHSGNEIHSRGNVIVGGNTLFVGPTADATGLTNPALIIFHGGDQYIQAALKNSLSNGSADWVSYGDNGTESQGWADMGFCSSTFNDANYTITGPGDGYLFVETFSGSYGGNLVLATGNLGTVKDIIFATNGFLSNKEFGRISHANNSLELTRAGASITFPDGSEQTTAYTGGGNTGNVTFDNVTVQGVNGLNLSAGSDFTANLAYLQVRAGDVASHIHLDTGNNQAYDLIVGDDQNYVQVSSTGNILLSSYDSNTAQYTWTLDYNGNLILAGGNSVIQSIANSSLDILNPNVSTMVLTPDPGYSSQALVLDPTSVGHIHLRSPSASSNIDDPSANLFLGGEASSFEVGIGYGSAPNVYVHSNNNTWTFDTTGNLTIPGTSGGMIKTVANGAIGIVAMDNGTNNPAQLLSINVGNGNATSIISAYASNATIQTNASGNINTWQFDNAGNLTLPTGGQIIVSGGLVSSGASPAPTINGFSITNSVGISGTGNISGGNISATGTLTSTGKIGYSTGGNATQSSTGAGVTVNQLTGLVTLATRTYNAGDLEAFSITCNKIAANDFVLVQMVDSVNAPSYNVVAYPNFVLANTISVLVKTLENVGTDTPILKFMIVKAPIS